jgi:hypothetical protein
MWLDANGKRPAAHTAPNGEVRGRNGEFQKHIGLNKRWAGREVANQLEYSMRSPFATDRFPRCLVAIIPPREAWNGGVRSWIMNPLKTQEK